MDDDLMWASCNFLLVRLEAAAGDPEGKFSYPIADLIEVLKWLMNRKEIPDAIRNSVQAD